MSIAVMKQALEALDHEANKGNDNAYQCERDALRAAIEQGEKRQWVGLTDEEIDKTYETQIWDARRSYARAIEAKLKEKNT